MKTIEELYNEAIASNELKKEFLALKPEEVENFAETHGCNASFDEVKSFLTEKSKTSSQGEPSELTDSEIEQAAGGKSATTLDVVISVCGLGVGCAAKALDSVAKGNCGTAIESEGFLCDAV